MADLIDDYSYIINSELKRNRRRLLAFFSRHLGTTFEDLKQEFYVCILSVLKKESYRNKSKSELQKIVRMSIRNYISDICTKGGKSTIIMADQSLNGFNFSNRSLHNLSCVEDWAHRSYIANQHMYNMEFAGQSFSNYTSVVYSTPEQSSDVSNLKSVIQKWGQDKDDEVRLFLKEVVDPSDAVLDKWDEILDNVGKINLKTGRVDRRSKYNLYKNTGQIPCTVFEQVLGIAASKCRIILTSLAKYLKSESYSLPALQYQK